MILLIYSLVGISIFVGLVNLVAVLFLSNAFFRVMVYGREPVAPPRSDDRGLVDPRESGTYDPRFRSSKTVRDR